MITFDTDPSRYRHWHLACAGPIATLTLDVAEEGGLSPGYRLKLNSYDLGVDIELHDALNRIRFEHPEVKAVVLTSGSYANPSWVTSLAYAKLTGAPTLGSLSSISPGGTASSTTFLKYDGTTFSYAVPPGLTTSGSSLLYGNGSGGASNATVGGNQWRSTTSNVGPSVTERLAGASRLVDGQPAPEAMSSAAAAQMARRSIMASRPARR